MTSWRRRNHLTKFLLTFTLPVLLLSVLAFYFHVQQAKPKQWVAPLPPPPEEVRIVTETELKFRYIYVGCGHKEYLDGGGMPSELESLSFLGLTLGELEQILPLSWRVQVFSGQGVTLEKTEELCSFCTQKGYIGIYMDRIAIYQGVPPDGRLETVTEFEVKEDIRDQLEKGIPYETPEELMNLLESYTS